MRTFPSEEALVTAYWRRLARSTDRTSGGKPEASSFLKSQAGSGVSQRLTGSRNVKPVMRTRRTRGSHMRNGRSTNVQARSGREALDWQKNVETMQAGRKQRKRRSFNQIG